MQKIDDAGWNEHLTKLFLNVYRCHNRETLSSSLTLENKSLIPFRESVSSMNVNSSDPTRVPW